jgi:peptide/nickel transport system permease protein
MSRYITQRLLLAIPTLLGITILTFVVLRVLLPTNVVNVILGDYGHNDEQLKASIRKELGLDGSLPSQYFHWMGGIMTGDLGKSLHSGRPISGELRSRVPLSLELGVWGLLTALLWSIPLGIWAAVKQDRFPDYGVRAGAILLSAVPGFWIAILLITFASIWFNWAPSIHFKSLTEDPIAHLKLMLVPGLIIGLTPSAGLMRLVRTVMLEVLREDYVRTARAKGLSSKTVLYRHALRNALIPVVTVVGIALPALIAGTVIFETIFVIPGMGRYLVDAVNTYDYPVIEAINLIFAALLLAAVLLVDISYAFLDPRIRYQ